MMTAANDQKAKAIVKDFLKDDTFG